jgi:hypothetical protein
MWIIHFAYIVLSILSASKEAATKESTTGAPPFHQGLLFYNFQAVFGVECKDKKNYLSKISLGARL